MWQEPQEGLQSVNCLHKPDMAGLERASRMAYSILYLF
jgi:hypothetical protein